ncbi:hypothetical protein [Streptomyces sp. NPDC055055]
MGLTIGLVLALLLAALSGLVRLPAAQHLRSLQDGRQASATLVAAGSGCFLGGCKVRFETKRRTVVANLPVGSGHGRSPAGTALTVQYREGDPQVVAAERDVRGSGADVAAVMFGSFSVLLRLMTAWGEVRVRR